MKKSLLILMTALTLVIAGCADDDEDTSTPIPVTKGTYDVEFFGSGVENCVGALCSLADAFYISNDCAAAENTYGIPIGVDGKNNCDVASGQVTLNLGKISIVENDNGTLSITTKMYMTGGTVELSAADKYQYTVYSAATKQDDGSYTGTGVMGSSLDTSVDPNVPTDPMTDFQESTFTITGVDSDTIRIDLTLVGKTVLGTLLVNAPTIVVANKVSDTPDNLTNEVPTLN